MEREEGEECYGECGGWYSVEAPEKKTPRRYLRDMAEAEYHDTRRDR
jgi:hypothetical protein